MPASRATRAHWSVSQAVALKAEMSLTPGVHSFPEKVLSDQQMNMPHFQVLELLHWRWGVFSGGGAIRGPAAPTPANRIAKTQVRTELFFITDVSSLV